MPTPDRRGYSINETAHTLGVHPDTVRHMIERGDLRARQVSGKGSRVVVFADSVEAFFASAQPNEAKRSGSMVASAGTNGLRQNITQALATGSISPADAVTLLRALTDAQVA